MNRRLWKGRVLDLFSTLFYDNVLKIHANLNQKFGGNMRLTVTPLRAGISIPLQKHTS